MAVTVDGLRLWQADESSVDTEANLDVTSVPSQEGDETLLVGLEAAESMSVSGLATGIRLTGESGYPSDPEDGLSQWVQEFESLVSAEQGDGWTVSDSDRNRTITATVTGGSWTNTAGAPLEARWTLDLQRGEGVLDDTARSPTTATPNASSTLGGTDLGTIDERQTSLSIDVEVTPIALAETSDTVIVPQSGTLREVSLSGRVGGPVADLRSFDDTMLGNVGSNQSLTYQTGFPGTSHTVMLGSYESTREGGSPSILRYSMTLFEGLTL